MREELKDLIAVLKKYPKGHVYYHDNGCWIYYKDRKAFIEARKTDDDDALNRLAVFYSDCSFDGYMPFLEQAFCHIHGITIETV